MTREEAKQWILEHMPPDDDTKQSQAMAMAIQALSSWEEYSDKLWKEAYERGKTEALSQEPCDDAISREWLMRKATERFYTTNYFNHISAMIEEAPPVTLQRNSNADKKHVGNTLEDAVSRDEVFEIICRETEWYDIRTQIEQLPPVTQKSGKWIPVSERLPDNTDPVNITWVNHDPESYYADIKDKPFTATGHYCNGKWWWYSVTCQDYLDECGHSDVDAMDEAIEVTAWMPLPTPYEPQEGSDKE